MKLDAIAKLLSDRGHIGLSDELARKLGLGTEEATRGRLMAHADVDRPCYAVYLLGAYVVNDTDFWGDGEIYWWSVPCMATADGQYVKSALYGLPNGAPPHKVGSHEWMTNLSLKDPPLLAVIPPEERITACTIRLGIYDDDGKPADLPAAMTAGLEAFAGVSEDPVASSEQIIAPVRQAIFTGLKAQEDDILIDQDVTIRRGTTVLFSSGLVGSAVSANVRVYYLVKDEDRTETFGPVVLHKGQTETVRFPTPMRGGGRLTLFARGADVACSAFGELRTETPFVNRVIDKAHEESLASGFAVTGNGPAKFVAYYTPP